MSNLIFTFILSAILVPVGVIDYRHQIIPNILNGILFVTGLVYSATMGIEQVVWSFLTALGTGAFFALLRWFYFRLRDRQGLGWGDVKFLAASGAWLSPVQLPWLILAASMSALLFVIIKSSWRRGSIGHLDRIAFGPHLALGLFAAWILKPYTSI